MSDQERFLFTTSIQYQTPIDKNKERYQLGDYHMIQHQTFRISTKKIIRNAWQRVLIKIFGVKAQT